MRSRRKEYVMTTPTIITLYLGASFAMAGLLAIINVHSAREAFWMALAWPGACVLLLLAYVLAKLEDRGWRVALATGSERRTDLSPWGFRRPPSIWRGWAVRCPWCELQVWGPA